MVQKIGARGHVAGLEGHAQAEGFDDAAADLEFNGIVAEQAEVARAAAGGDAGGDRDHASLSAAPFDQAVQVRGFCGFQRRHVPIGGDCDVPHAVHDDEGDLRVCLQSQFRIEAYRDSYISSGCPSVPRAITGGILRPWHSKRQRFFMFRFL